ncbi:hypothetical protein O6H91_15G012200 [Diphasiastrum complanatum]|uniref:Uncharacterized protein n=1 Tax=Diphasiastrum complanatum TaxID=34168 RepID=A0ACC2BFY8_DIPCM|nr:hypothetical protein O6H91_15G012200 [Diphasiastrum complanatum]
MKEIQRKTSMDSEPNTSLENGLQHLQANEIGLEIAIRGNMDAGALFVMESKGTWLHAGFHLTTSIASPSLLSLPFAFAGLGWGPGMTALVVSATVTFYSYCLMSKVLERTESQGHRHIRLGDLCNEILGGKWRTFVIGPLQFLLCMGSVISSVLLCGQSMKIIYSMYYPHGSIALYEFIIFSGVMTMILSQLPSFHSLRHLNLLSLLTCLGYSLCVVYGAIHVGYTKPLQSEQYSLVGSTPAKLFNAFNSLAIFANTYGSGIIPEIQATIAPPTHGKMFKGLLLCYAVTISTFFSVGIAGYWAFGIESSGNVMSNFVTNGSSTLIPRWIIITANVLIVIQLLAVALVYSQPTFDFMEGKASGIQHSRFSLRNLLPRLVLRSFMVAISTLIATMFPFFGDINAFIGAFCYTPLDFLVPVIFYSVSFKPSFQSPFFWINCLIIIIFSLIGSLGSISSIRQIVLDAKTYHLFANI